MKDVPNRLRSGRAARAALAGLLVASVAICVTPRNSNAFFQETTLEGTIGKNLGGVWLSVQQIMPEFRVNFPKPEAPKPPVPFEVGPIPASLEPLMGRDAKGVVVTTCSDPGACSEYGIFKGDVILKLNTSPITDVASFEKAVPSLPKTVLVTIRRPMLKMTTARLLKIKYGATEADTGDTSVLAAEQIQLSILDVKLPFASAVENTRKTHELWNPTKEQLEELGKDWYTLPLADPMIYSRGKHRIVAESEYDADLHSDSNTQDTSFAIVMDLEGNPLMGGGKNVDIYGIRSYAPDKIEGTYVQAALASAPFPISVEFKGGFTMYRVADYSDQDVAYRTGKEAKKAHEKLDTYKLAPDLPATPGPKIDDSKKLAD